MPVLSDLGGHQPMLIAIAVVFLILVLGRRVPLLGRLISLVMTLALAAALVFVLQQQERFNPLFARLAQQLHLVDPQQVVGDETRVPMAQDGHFWVRVRLKGVERRMLVDSGATITALSSETAAAAGLDVRATPFPMLIRTANGTVPAKTAVVPILRIGNVVARDLPVVVSPAFGDMNVVGMNFLSRLKGWRVEGGVLILTPHHPQAAG
ncbi:MAG: TIGR02281 family clan AA aspartic protease [Pseudomonadota bacterium]|nr:TIGR02281 family clan AA aspartic protease [Pseudomonadota bacterium]